MVNGVVSLRCPACSRPFISLPQRGGALVTCPHCARSAPMETYGAAAGTQGRPVASVPIQKRVILAKPSASAASPSSGMEMTSTPKVWPLAPEQSPQFTPQTHPLFPAAPIAPVWPTTPGIPGPSLFGLGALETPVSEPLPAVGPIQPSISMPGPVSPPTQPMHAAWPTPVEHPLAALRQSAASSAAAQPPDGMSRTVPAFQALGESDAISSAAHAAESVELGWRSAREERNVPLGLLILFLVGLCSWIGWMMSRPGMVAEFAAPTQPQLQGPATTQRAASIENEATMPLPGNEAGAPSQMAISAPEVPRAEEVPAPPTLDLMAARNAAETLLAKLFEAETQEARVVMVANGEDYALQMADFFKGRSLKLKSVTLAAFVPRSLPGQELVPLMEVKTNLNAQPGARLPMRPQTAGTFLLEWPLFAETHEQELAKFLASGSTQPEWLSVILKRSHAVELAETVRNEHFCVSLEASADDANRCLAVVPLDTPLARFFEREVEWGEVYAARLLLQWREVMGRREVVILDCDGAVTGAIFPSGSGR